MASIMIQGLILMGLVSYIQAATISCDAEEAIIHLSTGDAMLLGIDGTNDFWYIGSPDTPAMSEPDMSCRAVAESDNITIAVDACSRSIATIEGDSEQDLSFTWTIRKYTTDHYQRANACFDVRCVYDVDFAPPDLTIMPALDKSTSTVTSATTVFTVAITTYADSTARDSAGATSTMFTVPAKVYGRIAITNPDADAIFSIHVDECTISTTAGGTDPIYSIVANGIADTVADSTNVYVGGTENGYATFDFDSFQWVDPTDTSYVIQCTGLVCAQDGGDCGGNPFTARRRRRRSTFDERYFEVASRPLMFLKKAKELRQN